MNMRKQTWKAAVSAAAIAAGAAIPMTANAASITIDSVAQRWPWNNKVDITYTVTDGQNRAAGVYCGIEFNVSVPGYGDILLHGYSLGASAEGDGNGKQHTVTWTAPSGLKSTDCTISATLFTTNVPSGKDYMIVNLSSGEVYYEGLMTTQEASNDRYNTNAVYKTSKLVLRKVPKWADHGDLPNADALTALGGYPTGDNVNYSSTNSRKNWQTAKDYYVGMFLVTQRQYQNIYGSNPSQMTRAKTDDVVEHRPVEYLNWQTVRGNIQSTDSMTASSNGTFFQRLNFKTGLYFDLPTEVMFEIAQRAGATTAYSWGDSSDDMPDYCVCESNYGGTVQSKPGNYTCAVGSFLPNNWGIYDTAGNVWEWCRDRNAAANKVASGNMANNTDAFTPSSSGSYYIGRGFGGASSSQTDVGFRASYRYSSSSNAGWNRGFRVSHVVED